MLLFLILLCLLLGDETDYESEEISVNEQDGYKFFDYKCRRFILTAVVGGAVDRQHQHVHPHAAHVVEGHASLAAHATTPTTTPMYHLVTQQTGEAYRDRLRLVLIDNFVVW
jgi:hypothetical protein